MTGPRRRSLLALTAALAMGALLVPPPVGASASASTPAFPHRAGAIDADGVRVHAWVSCSGEHPDRTVLSFTMANPTDAEVLIQTREYYDDQPFGWGTDHFLGPAGTSTAMDLRGHQLVDDPDLQYRIEWWREGSTEPLARLVAPTGYCVDRPVRADRIVGTDRFDTAARIADIVGHHSSGQVWVVSGERFPDAVSAAAPAALGVEFGLHDRFLTSTMLLVRDDAVPAATRRALEQLWIEEIVLVGGPGVVGTQVERQLEAYGPVIRLAGEDRYETSTLAAEHMGDGLEGGTWLANGSGYADALAAAPIATRRSAHGVGSISARILLTRQDRFPGAVREHVLREDCCHVLLGGPQAISSRLEAELDQLSPTTIVRVAGSDRYGTAAALSSRYDTDPAYAIIASGENFPDALAGATLARFLQAPLLLVRQDEVPDVVMEELDRLSPNDLIILGGPGVVSTRVEEQLSTGLQEWHGCDQDWCEP